MAKRNIHVIGSADPLGSGCQSDEVLQIDLLPGPVTEAGSLQYQDEEGCIYSTKETGGWWALAEFSKKDEQ